MAWIEMSRDPAHGGGSWSFGQCLWSPTRTQDGRKWAYWSALEAVQPGDLIVHLRGRQRNAHFVGTSIAESPAQVTAERPPEPREWAWSQEFFRVFLRDCEPFVAPVLLDAIFREKPQELTAYHGRHSPLGGPNGKILFYVPQAGRLQCQNGAYFSELDVELSDILFGIDAANLGANVPRVGPDVATAEQLALVRARIGQQEFSGNVKDNYGGACCFPDCAVNDRSFLIGAHIARWADVPELRGQTSNGLCFCLLHDRAFERGLFTLDLQHRIRINNVRLAASSWATNYFVGADGQQIQLGQVNPAQRAIEEHWRRIGFRPA